MSRYANTRLISLHLIIDLRKSISTVLCLPHPKTPHQVKSILKLNPPGRPPHPNIVTLLELFRDPKERLHMVFEHMSSDVLQMIEKQNGVLFDEFVVQQIARQMVNGLAYMHAHGFFHRDLKPENLLCDGPGIVKIADFGQAREIRARPPFTDYVSTRWYRAPEVCLGATNYNSAVDVWGVGTVIYELLTLQVLFPGTSTIDQLFKIAELIGPITEKNWSEGAFGGLFCVLLLLLLLLLLQVSLELLSLPSAIYIKHGRTDARTHAHSISDVFSILDLGLPQASYYFLIAID